MNTTFKKALLAGTAIVAVGSVALASATSAFAADSFTEAGLAAGGTATVTGDGSNDDVWDIDTEDGTTTSDITVNTAGGAETLLVKSAGGVDATADIDNLSFVTSSASAFTLKVGDAAKAVALTINGNVAGDGTADMSFYLDADDGAGTAGAAATIDAKGNIDLGSGTITLDDDATGGGAVATLTLSGTGSQTITGAITAANAGDGILSVTNGGGTVTFASAIGGTAIGEVTINAGAGNASKVVFNGAITLATTTGNSGDINIGGTDGADSTTTFKATTNAAGLNINVGAAGATVDTHTLNFDATTASFVVTGAIAGVATEDTNTVNVLGGTGKTVTFATAMGSNIDDLNISTGTTLNNTGGGNLTATTIDLGTDAELNITAAATVTGDINGNGTLDIDENTTVVGSIGNTNDLTAIEVLAGKVLTVSAAAADRTVDAATITLQGAAAGLTLTPGANDIVVAVDVDTTTDGAGALIISDGAGSVTFQGDLGASTTSSLASLTIGNGSSNILNTQGNVFVDAVVFNDAGDTWNVLGKTVTVSGTVDSASGVEGVIVVGNGSTATNASFSSAIGTTTDTIAQLIVKGLSTANISKNVAIEATANTVAGLDIDDTATLNVDTDGGAVTVSDAVGDIDIDGSVSFTGAQNAALTAEDDIFIDGLNSLLVNLDTTKTFTLTATTGDDIDIGLARNTSIELNSATVINGNINFGTGAAAVDNRKITVTTGVSGTFDPTATYVMTAAGDTLDYDADAVVRYGINDSYTSLQDNDIILFVNSDANATLDTVAKTYVELETAGAIELIDTALVDFTVSIAGDEAQDLEIAANFLNADEVLNSDTAGAASALMAFPTATAELLDARGNLLAAVSTEDADNVAEALGPDVGGGAAAGTQIFTHRVESITGNRLAMARDGAQAQTGMAAGEMAGGSSWWVQGFGTMADQDERDGVDGYEADVLGVALGADSENVVDGATVGVALSYANIGVDSENATSTETDVDAFQIAVYGDYDLDSRTYVAGQVGYTWGTNDTTRSNVGGIAGLTANGDYDSNQISVNAEVGRDYMSGETKLTPKVVADYTWYSADDYTETGAGGANLNVDSDSQNVFNIGAGVDASWLVKHSDGSYIEPALHAVARYDLIGDEIETSSTWAGGGAAFTTEGADPARASLDLGADVTFHTTANWDLKAGYNFEVKQDFMAHSAQLKAAYKF